MLAVGRQLTGRPLAVYDGARFAAAVWTSGVPLTTVHLAGCAVRNLAQPGGIEARRHLDELLALREPIQLTVVAVDLGGHGPRITARVELPDGRDVTTVMCDRGWAAPWDGVGVPPVPVWPPAGHPEPRDVEEPAAHPIDQPKEPV